MKLEENEDVTSNFSFNLGLQDKAEQAFRDFGVHRMPEEEFEEMQALMKKGKEDNVLLVGGWNDLNQKYQNMKLNRSALSKNEKNKLLEDKTYFHKKYLRWKKETGRL